MLPIAYYLLKVIICSGILYGYYWLLLRNKVFHKYNRFYLMASVVLSLLLPLIKINFWQPAAEQPSGVIKVLQAVSSGDAYMDNIIVSTNKEVASFDITQLYPFAYLLVSLILLTIFLHTLFAIFNLLKKYPKQTIGKISFINTDAKSTPFSFLNYIFWNSNIDMETTTGNQIFKHEVAHVQEKHTYDKLFINIVLIFFWCNPFYWLYRKELNMIHEFIADKKAVEDSDTSAFAAMILQATYPLQRFHLTNNFFYSPIKRRLRMLTKNKNPKVNYLGRIMVLPLAVLVFAAFSLKTKTSEPINHDQNGEALNTRFQILNATATTRDTTAFGLYMIGNYSDTNYIKTSDYKSRALIVLDEKPIGNFGMQYVDSAHIQYNNIVIYNKERGKKEFGEQGKYGAIRLIQKSVVMIRADEIIYDDKTNSVSLKGDNTQLEGDFSDALIYLDGKSISPEQLKEIKPEKISAINVYKSEKMSVLFDIKEAKGKKVVIAITLKKDSLNEAVTAENRITAVNKDNNSSIAIISDIVNAGIFVNLKHADTNYLKTDEFKSKALVIIDAKEMGNVGHNYVEANMSGYSSVVIYNPTEAKKFYGEKGKYGIIKLTQRDAMLLTADSVFVDEKNGTVKLSGNKTAIKGDLSDALIYIDGKVSTLAQLNAIPPSKISSVSVLRGEKLAEIIETKSKKAVINVSLKPDDLQEVVVRGSSSKTAAIAVNEKVDVEKALIVFNGKIIGKGKKNTEQRFSQLFDKSLQITFLKKTEAIAKYGQAGEDGACELSYTEGITITTASVDADNINVVYIGIENPLTIVSNNIRPEDMVATISQGAMTGSAGKYIVLQQIAGEATIRILKKDGMNILGTFKLRVKRLPDPANPL